MTESQLCTRLGISERELEGIKSVANEHGIEYLRCAHSCFVFQHPVHSVPFTFVIDDEWRIRRRLRFHAIYRPSLSHYRLREEGGGGGNLSVLDDDLEGTMRACVDGGPGMDERTLQKQIEANWNALLGAEFGWLDSWFKI
jgi:hypothetical protein